MSTHKIKGEDYYQCRDVKAERDKLLEEVAELLLRLEASESDALEQARLNGMGAERELALMAKLEAAEKERDALRAKIDAMEQQYPVGTLHDDGCFVWSAPRPYESNYAGWKMKLYLAPGAQAQPAQSVPDGFVWPECPKRRQSHVLFDDGYEEGWAACVATIKAMTNTTPEAKP